MHAYRARQTHPQSRTHTHTHTWADDSTKVHKQVSGEGVVLSTHGVGTTRRPYAKKKKETLIYSLYTKISLKIVVDLNMKEKHQLLKENIQTTFVFSPGAKISQPVEHQKLNERTRLSRDTVDQVSREAGAGNWKKRPAHHVPDEGLLSRAGGGLSSLSNEKTTL